MKHDVFSSTQPTVYEMKVNDVDRIYSSSKSGPSQSVLRVAPILVVASAEAMQTVVIRMSIDVGEKE